jgi:signal transduction histidine kinase/ActR/RegA family two-component response regulator
VSPVRQVEHVIHHDNKPAPRRRLRLRTILTLLVLATTVPLGLFAARLIRNSWVQQQVLVDRQNIEQARATSAAVDLLVDRAIAALRVLAALEPMDGPDRSHFTESAARIVPLHPGWDSVRLVDPSLRVLADTRTKPGDAPAPLLSPDWPMAVLQTGEPAVSRTHREPGNGDWVVSIGIPVKRPDKTIKYVLGAMIHAQAFTDILNRTRVPAGAVVTLLDTTPVIMARTRNQDKYIGQPPSPEFVARSRTSPEGTWRSTLLEGTQAYSAWSRSPITGWTIGVGVPASAIDRPIRASFVTLTGVGLFILGAGIMLASYLSRGIVRAHRAAGAAAQALARGEVAEPFRSRIAEADDLSAALREAARILQARLRERDDAQREVDRNRAMLLEQEQAGRQAAEALSRAKDEFVATVSHELRTPLNAIYGWVALLKTGKLDESRQAHALDVIERNTRAQAQLIEDLLDMSRVIRGALRLDMRSVSLAEVLDAAVDSARPTAAARQISLTVHDGPELIASADHSRLQQVFWNLLANALKFTPSGGHVEARIAVDGQEAVVEISDDGEGIAPEFLPHVFDRFRQETGDITRTHSGLGIGLALVRHLTELHGGTVSARSPGKGKGSTFCVRLPIVREGRGPVFAADPAPGRATKLVDLHALVVDDDADARELVATALGQAGARVTIAASGSEAAAIAGEVDVNLVLTDLAMPNDSGYDLLRMLRANPRTARLPVVAITAYNRPEDRERATAAGFDAHVAKPFHPAQLVDLLAAIVRRVT